MKGVNYGLTPHLRVGVTRALRRGSLRASGSSHLSGNVHAMQQYVLRASEKLRLCQLQYPGASSYGSQQCPGSRTTGPMLVRIHHALGC